MSTRSTIQAGGAWHLFYDLIDSLGSDEDMAMNVSIQDPDFNASGHELNLTLPEGLPEAIAMEIASKRTPGAVATCFASITKTGEILKVARVRSDLPKDAEVVILREFWGTFTPEEEDFQKKMKAAFLRGWDRAVESSAYKKWLDLNVMLSDARAELRALSDVEAMVIEPTAFAGAVAKLKERIARLEKLKEEERPQIPDEVSASEVPSE